MREGQATDGAPRETSGEGTKGMRQRKNNESPRGRCKNKHEKRGADATRAKRISWTRDKAN